MTGDNSNDFANFVITLHTEKHRKEFSLKFLPSYIQGNKLNVLQNNVFLKKVAYLEMYLKSK